MLISLMIDLVVNISFNKYPSHNTFMVEKRSLNSNYVGHTVLSLKVAKPQSMVFVSILEFSMYCLL